MAMNEPTSPLTSLPNVDDLPTTRDGGYQAPAVRPAQEGAEQLLSAAGLGADRVSEVIDAIVDAAQATTAESRGPAPSLIETPPEIDVPEPEAHSEDKGEEESSSEPEQHGEDTT